jgi:hypothetical protein
VRRQGHRRRFVHQLQVAHGRQLQRQVLQSVRRLVDHQHVQHNVVLVHVHVGLRVHGVGEAGELDDFAQFGGGKVKFGWLRRRSQRLGERKVEQVGAGDALGHAGGKLGENDGLVWLQNSFCKINLNFICLIIAYLNDFHLCALGLRLMAVHVALGLQHLLQRGAAIVQETGHRLGPLVHNQFYGGRQTIQVILGHRLLAQPGLAQLDYIGDEQQGLAGEFVHGGRHTLSRRQ